jgi:hypothetical protein
VLSLKRAIIWVDSEDKDHEEVLHKIKILLSLINAKYTIVDVLNVNDEDRGGQ